MDARHIGEFHNSGYTVLEDFFTDEDLSMVSSDISHLVDLLANKLGNKLQNKYENEEMAKRLTLMERDCPGSAVTLHTMAARTLGKGIGSLFTNPKLLDAVEAILGPDIAGHPEWNIRPKTPSNPLFDVPWHQDTAYLDAENEKYRQVVAWIPLTDVDSQNGALQIVKGGHKLNKCFTHTIHDRKGSWYLQIEDATLFNEVSRDDVVTVAMKRGSLLLFTNLTPHRSTPNLTDTIRWSVDIRFMRPQDPSGFSGAEKVMLLRTKEKGRERIEIDWKVWGEEEVLMKREGEGGAEKEEEEISGPWMDRWKK